MLIEKSKQLTELAQRKKDLQSFLNNLKTIQTRQSQINQAFTTIKPLLEAVVAFRDREIISMDLTKKIDVLLSFISNVENNYKENPDWILDNQNFQGNIFKSNIDSLRNTIESQLSQAWKKYLLKNKPSTNDEILSLLGKIEVFKQTVTEIRTVDNEIKKVIYPKNELDFKLYEAKIEQLKNSWNNLNSDEVPQSVLRFLSDAANQEASLDLLNPEVQEWINKHNISNYFKICLK